MSDLHVKSKVGQTKKVICTSHANKNNIIALDLKRRG